MKLKVSVVENLHIIFDDISKDNLRPTHILMLSENGEYLYMI